MENERLISLMAAQTAILNRIATALETIALTNAPAPNFIKPIEAYSSFDFTAIGALIKQYDPNGPTELEWGGYLWTRRSPQNKFGEAIWFSRPTGKDAEGNVKYARLITFKKLSEAEPLPRKVEALVETKATTPPPTQPEKAVSSPTKSELDEHLGTPKITAQPPAPQTAATNGNGNGKAQRPLSPDRLKEYLLLRAATHKQAATPQQRSLERSLAANQLEACFAGDMDSDLKRREVQSYLLEVDSLRDATDGQILAMLDWLKPTKDSGGQYLPDLLSVREAQAVLAALEPK